MIIDALFQDLLLDISAEDIYRGYKMNSIDQKDELGETLLLASCKARKCDDVEFCLRNGASTSFPDGVSGSPLHQVIDTAVEDEDNSLRIAKLLLEFGVNIEQRGYMFKTPFLLACSRDSLFILKLLVEHGCNVLATVIDFNEELDALYFSSIFQKNTEAREFVKEVFTHNKRLQPTSG